MLFGWVQKEISFWHQVSLFIFPYQSVNRAAESHKSLVCWQQKQSETQPRVSLSLADHPSACVGLKVNLTTEGSVAPSGTGETDTVKYLRGTYRERAG